MHKRFIEVHSNGKRLKLYALDEDMTVDYEKLAKLLPDFNADGQIGLTLVLGCDDCQTAIEAQIVTETLPSLDVLEGNESQKARFLRDAVFDILEQLDFENDFPDFIMPMDDEDMAEIIALLNHDGPIN